MTINPAAPAANQPRQTPHNGSIEYVQYTAKREKQESLFKRLVR